MRVTTSQAQRSQLDYIQANLQRLVKAQDQAATGRRFVKGSEDPSAATDVLRANATLDGYAQYQRNGDLAIARASEEDRTLSSVENLIERARELATQQVGAPANAETRILAKSEIDQIITSVVALGNTRFNEGYLFGGTRSQQAPMANTPNSVPPFVTNNATLASPAYEIASGVVTSPNHTAHEIFRDTNVLTALRDLSTALGNNDPVGVNNSIPALSAASDGIGRLIGEVGAKVNQYETIKTQMQNAVLDTKTRRSIIWDIDMSDAAANFAQAQTAYQAALAAANRVINLNVTDYLK